VVYAWALPIFFILAILYLAGILKF
jgi:hypothetical protein